MMERVLMTIFVLTIFFIGTQVQGASVLANLPLREKHHHLLSKLSHYELVRPYRSTPDGDFLSNDLSTTKEEEHDNYKWANRNTNHGKEYHSRYGRSVDDRNEDAPLGFYYFRVDAFGAHLKLNVTRNRYLVSPKMRVEQYKEDGTKYEFRPNTLCFYTGGVTDVAGSSVAISNCDGLSGSIQANNEEYIIEPLVSTVGQSRFNVSQGHLHVMYRTRDVQVNSAELGRHFNINQHRDTIRLHDTGMRFTKSTDNILHRRRKSFDEDQSFVVETLIAADHSVASYHGVEELPVYLLTMLNIMNKAYKHESMSVDLKFVATRIIVLNEEQSATVIDEGKYRTSLANVFQWVSSLASGDHDYASFVTRVDFGPAGFAPISAMCMSYWSSSITSDQGLISSFIMAHEAAHVLGIEHDGADNKCEPYLTSIMSPLILATYHDYYWSNCSVKYLKKHLRIYPCLEDNPFRNSVQEVTEYPGELYSLERQCQLTFGPNSRQCGMPEDFNICIFRCSDHSSPWVCKDYHSPALDGTSCGYGNQWCMKGVCKNKPAKTNGRWGKWSAWGECSYDCGVGVKTRQRKCDNPRPAFGGKECKGKSFLFKICNKQPCPVWVDRRAQQCTDHLTSILVNGKSHVWLPYESRNNSVQCRLKCISEKTLDVLGTPYMVTDGTPCSYDDHHSICIRGQCLRLGCDMRIRSKAMEDNCGVCKGDNSECRFVQKVFVKSPKQKYQRIDTLPAGAYNIIVKEESNTNHFLALRTGKTYILNSGGSRWGRPEFVWGGARFVYFVERDHLSSVGPLHADLMLMVYWTNDTNPVNITYSYYMNKNVAQRTKVDAGLRQNPLSRPSAWFVKTPNQGVSLPQSRYRGTVKTSTKPAAPPTEDLMTLIQEPFKLYPP